ncbi:hypothetical protein CDAR_549131 [Caerostris darwini]|uniref:Uncharacterized protein n=1 Tax=Caerostris darwini TaxID=1538125 RepID=A0AAV4WI84_9ARAC|nr:hypothetical protein CDAR_549131 [Caerostris darwini]
MEHSMMDRLDRKERSFGLDSRKEKGKECPCFNVEIRLWCCATRLSNSVIREVLLQMLWIVNTGMPCSVSLETYGFHYEYTM